MEMTTRNDGADNSAKRPEKLPRGIRKRGESYMIDVTRDGTRHTATFATLKEAQKARDALKASIAPGRGAYAVVGQQLEAAAMPPQSTWTLQEAYERTLSAVWSGKPIECMSRYHMKDVCAFFGPDALVSQITTERIDDFITWLRKTKKSTDGTINAKLSTLSRVLRTAMERGKLMSKPLIPHLRMTQGRIRFFTGEEEAKILATFSKMGAADHVEVTIALIDTGFRLGEMMQMTPRHVDLERRTLTVWKTKNKHPRTIPLTTRTHQIMERRCAAAPHQDASLWPSSRQYWYSIPWRTMRRLAGFEHDTEFVPHALRHTCCSRLVQRGVPLVHIQRWMGHNNIQTTMRYAHLAPQDLFSAAKVLENAASRWE